MLHFNRFPVNSENCGTSSFVRYDNTGEFMIRRSFSHKYQEEPLILDDTNCQYINQNDNLQDCIKGCQVLGFIPDHTTLDYPPTQSCCNYSSGYRNQLSHARRINEYSSKPTQNSLRVSLKRKRKRTIFTTEQIIILEGVFQKKPYITREERAALMNKMQLSEKAIKVWFQNRRRITDKKYPELTLDSPSSVDTQDSFSQRLAFIETEIEENTDENGYVTLNDNVMSELVSAIHDYLSKDVYHYDSQPLSNSSTTEDVVMYEPISPASSDIIEIS